MKSNKTITKPTSKPVKSSGKIRTGGVVVTTPTKPVKTSIADLRERLAISKKVAPAKPVTKPVSVDKIKTRFDDINMERTPKPVPKTEAVTEKASAVAVSVKTEAQEKTKAVFTDLHPWPFEKKFKGVIRRREWNGLVANIQKDACSEMHAENESLHATVAELLNERDLLRARFDEMREFMRKQQHDFDTKFN